MPKKLWQVRRKQHQTWQFDVFFMKCEQIFLVKYFNSLEGKQ